MSMSKAAPPNYGVNATVRPVTPRAAARVAPTHAATDRGRSADKTIGTRPDDVRF